jgi:uncharacterized protein (DUF362 family)
MFSQLMCSEMRSLSRRSFLTKVSSLVALGLAPRGSWAGGIGWAREELEGRVVIIRKAHEAAKVEDSERTLGYWIQRALEELTGQKGKEAWRRLFSPEDRVAIKVNAMGGQRIATSRHLALAMAKGLMEAGIPAKNILIFDRSTAELQRAGYEIVEDGSGPLCFGTDRLGYEPEPRVHGSIGGCFTPILTRWATVLVNMPVLKDHDLAGVSLSMKNLFGLIHNPNKYHDSGCSPYLVDLLDHPEVKKKLRLVLCDGLKAQCHGGPAYNGRWAWSWGGILMATDPVALDRVGERVISQRRREVGLPSLEEEGRGPEHISLAARRGLGKGDPRGIDIKELDG